ncbi:MAG: hypothetical protein AB7S80_13545 [Rhizobiaceae bacterium]
MKINPGFLRRHPVRVAAAAGMLLAVGLVGVTAQPFPGGRNYGGPPTSDLVTGYMCVTPGCEVVRLPDTNCICKKENPAETRLSKLKLTCSTKQAGEWVQCPVKPRYGN